MRGRMMMVLASAALAGSLLATDAQALGGGGHGGDGSGGDGFRGNHFSGGFGATSGDGYGGYTTAETVAWRIPRVRGRDVWGTGAPIMGPWFPRFELSVTTITSNRITVYGEHK
jgi:hypothetical protein